MSSASSCWRLPSPRRWWRSCTVLPLIGTVLWQRAILPLTFGIAVLAGVGMDALVRSPGDRAVRRWAGGGFAVVALVLVGLWVFGRGDLPADQATIRAKSFIWPAVETALGIGVVVALTWMHRRSDAAGDPQGIVACHGGSTGRSCAAGMRDGLPRRCRRSVVDVELDAVRVDTERGGAEERCGFVSGGARWLVVLSPTRPRHTRERPGRVRGSGAGVCTIR